MISFRTEYRDSVESTMDIVREYAVSGDSEGYAIQAGEQVTGRGRQGRKWVSQTGNLYISILFRPQKSLKDFGQMAFVAALSLYDTFIKKGVNESDIRIKWPNDILLNDKKACGLLLEAGKDQNGDDFLILGAGVNIFVAPNEFSKAVDFIPEYRDAQKHDNKAVINDFRDCFFECCRHRYEQWHSVGFSPIKDHWLRRAKGRGEHMIARLPEQTYEGIFEGIDESGALLLTENSGITRKILSGDVFFGQTANNK